MSLIEKIDAEIERIKALPTYGECTDSEEIYDDGRNQGWFEEAVRIKELILSEQKEPCENTEQNTEIVVTVKELIELLVKSPQSNIILADIGQEESAEVIDVLIGNGTARGFTYLKIKPYAEQKEPCEYCGQLKSLYANNDYTESEVREIYVELDGTMTVAHLGGYDDINFKINFCPLCGRPLNPSTT